MNSETLTIDEVALLTPFNAVAHDLMRKKARDEWALAPCWLCCSDEARQRARDQALLALRAAACRPDLCQEEADEATARYLPETIVDRWREAEVRFKLARESGNPRGFFAEY